MEERDRISGLRRNILLTMSIFFVVQCTIFLTFALVVGFESQYWTIFLPISTGYHILILILLLLFQNDFYIEYTGQKLDRINLANIITLSRVSSMPTLLVLVIAAKEYSIRIPVLILIALIFLTDFFDGLISRKTNQVTKIGRTMDSVSDYALLIVLSIIFQYYLLIPGWLFWLIITRFGIQALLMAVLMIIEKRIEPKSTFMGKVTIASIMVLYTLEILRVILQAPSHLAFRIAEWIVAIIIVIGIFDKIASFFDTLKSKPSAP